MVHRGRDDDEIIVKQGMAAFRRARIPDLAQEALSQGTLLTNEDLAFHIYHLEELIRLETQGKKTHPPEMPR